MSNYHKEFLAKSLLKAYLRLEATGERPSNFKSDNVVNMLKHYFYVKDSNYELHLFNVDESRNSIQYGYDTIKNVDYLVVSFDLVLADKVSGEVKGVFFNQRAKINSKLSPKPLNFKDMIILDSRKEVYDYKVKDGETNQLFFAEGEYFLGVNDATGFDSPLTVSEILKPKLGSGWDRFEPIFFHRYLKELITPGVEISTLAHDGTIERTENLITSRGGFGEILTSHCFRGPLEYIKVNVFKLNSADQCNGELSKVNDNVIDYLDFELEL